MFSFLLLTGGVVGCGGSSGPTAVTIQGPASANVDPGDSATFTATVTGDSNSAGVTWTLTGCTGTACGALSGMSTTTVTYTAPSIVTTAFTVTITATSVAKTGLAGTTTISVPVNLGITTAAGALAGGTVGTAYSVTLTETGGVSPYTWTVTTGALPAGLSLNGSTGMITGTPTAAGSPSFTVTLTDSGSPTLTTTVKLSISIASPPAIVFSTTSLAGGTVGTAYSAAVAATGGAGTLTYALASGTLPAGLSLSSAGAIAGTPTKSGSSTVTVKATDAYGDTGTSGSLSIAIAAAPAIVFSTTSLVGGTVGTAYSAGVAATGGAGTLTYALASGSLPAGLSLSSAGAITGKPTAAGTGTFTVKATDAYGDTGTSGSLSIAVVYPALTITPATLTNGTVGTAYSATLSASGGSGSGYSFTVTSGTGLSAVGLSLSSGGAVSGTPSAAETAGTFVVKVTDGAGNTASATITLTVTYPPLSITTASLPAGIVGGAYSVQLASSGGSGTGYAYTVSTGTGLSAVGLTLSSGGLISGSPTAAESAGSVTVKVTDSASNTATATFSVTIDAALTITPATLANGTVGTAYSATLSASGGSGSGYTFVVSSGTGLTAVGLSLSSGGAVSGTPSAAETAGTFVVRVTDGAGNTGTATVTLTVVYPALTVTTTSLANGSVGVAYSQTLGANGGSGNGFTWTVTSGSSSLSAVGLSVSSGGVVSGTAPTAGTANFTVKVTDSAGNTATETLTVTISTGLTVTTTSLPNGTVGTAYSQTLGVSGGSGTGYTWSVTTGASSLGSVQLSLSSGGVLTGTPTSSGTANFTVQVKDSLGNTATQALTVTITAALTITTTSLPNGTAGTAYSETLSASGGSGTGYTWSVTSGSSSLSGVGLSVSSGGVVSGATPTAGTATFTVKVTDSAGDTASGTFSIVVDASLTVTTTSLPNGTKGTAYSATLGASGGTGTGYTWTVTSGTGLSAVGLSLSTGGVISGTPTAVEAATQFTVKVTDSGGNTATATLGLIVNYATLSITTASIPGATVNVAYSETFNAAGGSGNYSWSVTSGLSGLTGETLAFTTGGVLSGTPTTVEDISFTVQVKDTTTNDTASASFTLDVSSAALASCTHDGSGNALLNGNYAFGLSGFDPNGHFYDEIGDFAADGSGAISGGNGDVNGDQNISNFSSGEVQYSFTGTYSIGSTDNRGIMTLTNTNSGTPGTELPSSTSYCFVADNVTGGVAQSGTIIQADGSGFILTGHFTIQTTSDFTLTALNGNYVFGMQGVDGTGPNRRGFIGLVALDGSGDVSSGQFDHSSVNYNGTTYSSSYSAANAITSSGSSYTVGTNGRGTLTLNAGSGNVLTFVTYVFGTGNQFFILSTNASSTSTTPLLAGSAHKQSTTSYTTASVEGTSVFRSNGTTDPNVSPIKDNVVVGQLSLDGSGNASFTTDENDGGVITGPTVSTGTYAVTSAGYLTVTGPTNTYLYLYAPGAGFGLDTSTGVDFVQLVSQTVPSGGFTSSDLNGSYGAGTISPAAYNGTPVSGGVKAYPQVLDATATFSAGSLALTQDSDSAPGLAADVQVDQTSTSTWALDSTYGATTGRFTLSGGGGGTIAGYLVSPTQAFLFEVDGTNGSTLVIEVDHQ